LGARKVEPEAWKEVVREGLERLRAAGLFDEYSQDNEEVEYLKAVAAEALGRIGDTATPAVPALLAALQDPGRGSFGVRVARPPFWASRGSLDGSDSRQGRRGARGGSSRPRRVGGRADTHQHFGTQR